MRLEYYIRFIKYNFFYYITVFFSIQGMPTIKCDKKTRISQLHTTTTYIWIINFGLNQ